MSEPTAPLIEAPKRRGPVIAAVVVVLAVVIGLLVWALGGDDEGTESGAEKVRLGVVGASDPYWQTFVDAAKDENIDVEVIDFSDYTQPNPATTEGEIDVNQFQHIVYLADYNVSNKQDLKPIGATAIYPLGMYSKKVDSVDELKKGDEVTVPDDDSNQARALLVLQSAGLIELKDGGTIFSTLADIDKDASKVKVRALKADLTPTSLPDVAAAFINNDFVARAGLEFSDAILQDDAEDESALPYANIFVTTDENKDNPTFKKLVEIYQETEAVQDGVLEVSGDTAVMLKTPVEELEKSLAKVEADTRAAKK